MSQRRKIYAKVNCNAKVNGVIAIDNRLQVNTTAKPQENKANDKVIELVAMYYGIPKSNLKISHGLKSKLKTVEIIDNL